MKHDVDWMFLGAWYSALLYSGRLFTLGIFLCAGLGWAAQLPLELSALPSEESTNSSGGRLSDDFYAGVKAYREGHYQLSHKIFKTLHQEAPENVQYTYYLAISEAQLGRFQKAKQLYEEIVTLAPNGKAAALAQKGLDYLPRDNDLDLPPRFQSSDTPAETKPVEATTPPPFSQSQSMVDSMRQGMQGMSPQDWMMLQMMQSQNNGQNNGTMGGMNPMSWMMMPGMNGGANGSGGYDPNVMSNMMMNQMMQGFGMGGDNSGNP
jgi:hypothetical protein